MKDRYLLEDNEAAPESGAAFILDKKSGLRARIVQFRTLRQLDAYQVNGATIVVRRLPILLEISADQLGGKWIADRVLKGMEAWYYHQVINPPPADTPPASGSAG